MNHMTPAGHPAAGRPAADHRDFEQLSAPTAPALSDPFDMFVADARHRKAQAEAEATAERESGDVRPQDWADPDPAALNHFPARRHPVDRALARSKQGATRRAFEGKLGRCLQLLTNEEHGRAIDEDLYAYPWHQLSTEDAADFRHAVYRRYKPQSSRNDMVSALRRIVHQRYRCGVISALRRDLLMEQLYTVSVGESTRRRRLSAGEIAALLGACDRIGDDRTTARNTAIVALFYTSGIRSIELVNIDLHDWDRADQSMLLRDTKNGRPHRILLHPGVLPYLNRWADHRGTAPGALFTGLNRTDTTPLTTFSVRYMLRTRAEAASVAPFGCHDFRRTFATDLLEKHDPFLVSRLLNHSKIESTTRYDLRADGAKRDAIAGLSLPNIGQLTADEPASAEMPGRAA